MDLKLDGMNIIILAKNHNPSIISREWLRDKKIIEGDITNFAHTPAFSVVETETVSIVADPERLQISLKKDFQENITKLQEIADRYVEQLPETPYTAIGINYLYSIPSEKDAMKRICSVDEEKFGNLFPESYQLGSFIKFKYGDFLARLSLQPEDSKIIADINFHCEVYSAQGIREMIERAPQTKGKAEEVLEEFFGE
ncbi:hypothetical protein MSLAZ_2992 [Methanosarcina lacustris Z-7289]|uniref:Uncharacterized protein n=1 Tax=Methanosarcina lacustris Z-7289 TaxID=1434111 RepID=A0A0E3SAJ1_9EURY|nr:hypothetical protein [Methanosarcina lacustris]AKB76253.1 hypothetical protein MSLAZ_2992 [Methanosarcina lacustris Z-7289]